MQCLALSFLLCGSLFTQKTTFPDLDFRSGTLGGWEGDGFAISKTDLKVRQSFWVSSRDYMGKGRKAMLHRAFVVPPEAGIIRFSAYAARGPGCSTSYSHQSASFNSSLNPRALPSHAR